MNALEREATTRVASGGDAAAIVRLVRQGFSPEVLSLFIYGCSGVTRYVRHEIEQPQGFPHRAYKVALSGGRVVGMIDLRVTNEGVFLNYVATARSWRSQGLGSRLLYASTSDLCRKEARELRIELDVLEENEVARNWYKRLGFAQCGEKTCTKSERRDGKERPSS